MLLHLFDISIHFYGWMSEQLLVALKNSKGVALGEALSWWIPESHGPWKTKTGHWKHPQNQDIIPYMIELNPKLWGYPLFTGLQGNIKFRQTTVSEMDWAETMSHQPDFQRMGKQLSNDSIWGLQPLSSLALWLCPRRLPHSTQSLFLRLLVWCGQWQV